MGGVVGVVFCLIGLFVVIPSAGPFGVLWTAVAVFITGSNLYNAFSEKGMASHTIEIDEEGNGSSPPFGAEGYAPMYESRPENRVEAADTVEERLERLNDLYDKRLVTQREYEEKRKEILKDL